MNHPEYPGSLIVFEGIDGTGKSTQTRWLKEHLEAMNHQVVLSREPTNGPWGQKLRESAEAGRLAPQDELDFFLRDRSQHVDELILPSLRSGKVVILDRYYFSSMAYQGNRGFDPAEIRRKNEVFAPQPDLLLILDLDVETAHQRIGGRGDTTNEFEQKANLQRCRDIFLSLQEEPYCEVIDASKSMEGVSETINNIVSTRLSG